MKKCPYCAEEIAPNTAVCPHCGSPITTSSAGVDQPDDGHSIESNQLYVGAKADASLSFGESSSEDKTQVFSEAEEPFSIKELDNENNITEEQSGRYVTINKIGQGGMGRVLLALDRHIGREIAFKELVPDQAGSGNPLDQSPLHLSSIQLARFLREARITGRLEHPGIVPVYEIGKRSDGSNYYTMKVVRGKTLSERVRDCVNIQDKLHLLSNFQDICQAIAYAHSRGVIHRDLKPSNIMVGEFGETVVLDWGLAKAKGGDEDHNNNVTSPAIFSQDFAVEKTSFGEVLGTPSYMSPEQAQGKIEEIDERSDVWSLGAILYQILTGFPPFTGTSALDIIGKVASKEAEPVLQIEPKSPPELAAIAMKCLKKNPSERYATARELSSDVEAYVSGTRVSSYDYSLYESSKRWIKSHPVVTTMMAGMILLLIISAFAFDRIREQRNIAQNEKNMAVEREQEAKSNLSLGYLNMARWAEERGEVQRAQLYLAKSINEKDNLAGHLNLNFLQVMPKISLKSVHTLKGHQGCVRTISFSPDGKILATGSVDKTIKLWSMDTRKLIRTLEGHQTGVQSISFSPDGKRIASGSGDGTIMLWSTETGKLIGTPGGNQHSSVRNVSFSPDGKTIACSSEMITIKIYNSETSELICTLKGHQMAIDCISFSPDGSILASVSRLETILWNVKTGEQIRSLDSNADHFRSLAFSHDGTLLATARGSQIINLWNVKSGELVRTLGVNQHIEAGIYISFSPDGKTIASGGQDNVIKLWSVETGEQTRILEGHQNSVESVTFSPDGKTIASGGYDTVIKLWSVETEERIRTLTLFNDDVNCLSFSPDSKILASGSDSQYTKLWNINTGEIIQHLNTYPARINSVSFSPDGKTLASGGEDNTIKLWNVENGNLIRSLEGHRIGVKSVSFSPDGKTIASGSYDETIKLWSVENGQLIRTIDVHPKYSNPKTVAFSPDGKILASGISNSITQASNTIKLWSTDTGKLIRSLEQHQGGVNSIFFSSNGKILASGSSDDSIKLWKVETGELIRTIKAYQDEVSSISLSADGRVLASGGWNKFVKLWSIDTGELLYTLKGHKGPVTSVSFSLDGKILASGSRDGTIKLWPLFPDILGGDPQYILEGLERSTGLRVIGMDVYSWNPETGEVAKEPLPRPF